MLALIPLTPYDSSCKQPKKVLKQVNIFDTFIKKDTNAKLSQYAIFRPKKISKPLAKIVFKIVKPKKFVTPNKVIIFKEFSSGIQVFNSCYVNDIKNLALHKNYKKSCLVIKTNNNKNKNFELT